MLENLLPTLNDAATKARTLKASPYLCDEIRWRYTGVYMACVAIKEYLPATLAMREGRTTVVPRSDDHAEQFAWGRERFLDEARTLARLDLTPAIVRVHDFLEENGTAYMVMALIEGDNLNRRLMRSLIF